MKKLAYSFTALKDFDNCPQKFYRYRVSKEVKDGETEALRYGTWVHAALEQRVRDGLPLPDTLKQYEGIAAKFSAANAKVEQEYTLDYRMNFTTWFGKDVFFRAKIDVETHPTPESATLWDFKTGTRRVDPDQLEINAWLMFRKYPEVKTIKAGFIWLKDGKIDTFEFDRQTHAEHIGVKTIIRTKAIERAQESNNWPGKPSGLCRFCGWQPHCIYK